MTKVAIAALLTFLCACGETGDGNDVGPDAGVVDPTTSTVYGEWFMTFDGTACGKQSDTAIGFRLVLDGGNAAVETWALHAQWSDAVELTVDGAVVVLETTFGPYERVELDLVDGGVPAAIVRYTNVQGTEDCSLGPVEAQAVAHTPQPG